jgi:transcriptional regulator with XRE-family HTH domain
MPAGKFNIPPNKREAIMREFGRRFSALLDEHGLTQADAARLLSTSRDNVHNWVHGTALPRRQTAEKIAKQFGVMVTELMPPVEGRELDWSQRFEVKWLPTRGQAHVLMDMVVPLSLATKIAALISEKPS